MIEPPINPTERVIPAPPVPPRSTIETPTGPPVAPGLTVPSVATPQLLLPGSAGAGLPPAAIFEFHPSVTLSEEYSDNFNLTHDNRTDNLRSTISPGLTLFINNPFTKGTITSSFSLTEDTSTSDFSQFYSVAGRVVWEATPLLTLSLSDSLTHSDEPSQADRLGLRRVRETFTSNQFSTDLAYRFQSLEVRPYYRLSTFFQDSGQNTVTNTAGTSASMALYETNTVTAGYAYGSSTTSDASDVTTHQFNVALSRQLSTQATAGIAGSLGLFHETGGGSPDQRFKIWNVSLFNSYTLTNRLTWDGSIGVSILTPEGGGSRSGPSTATTLSYRFAGVTAILGVDAGYSATFEAGQDFGIVKTEGVTTSVSYAFSPALSASLGAYYRHNETTGFGGAGTPGANQGQKEKNWGATASISLQLQSWLNLGIQYIYTNSTDESSEGNSFTENRVQASLRAAF